MKQIFLVFFLAIIFCFFIFSSVQAAPPCDESARGTNGLVPCGRAFNATGPVCPCVMDHLFLMATNIYSFAVKNIVAPLATIMLVVGAILLMISGGNPTLAGFGKKAMWASIIGAILAFGSLAIINLILTTIGVPPVRP